MSTAEKSPLVKALDQFIQQHKSCAEEASGVAAGEPLDRPVDSLVLTTRRQSGEKITEILPRLLRGGLRDRSDAKGLVELRTSAAEKEVAETIEAVLRDRWTAAYGVAPNQDELATLLRLIWVQVLDVEDGQVDATALLDFLRSIVLATPSQAGLASIGHRSREHSAHAELGGNILARAPGLSDRDRGTECRLREK